LPKLLKSLVNQKEKDFEAIVADGGSEDKTLKLARDFQPLFKKMHQDLYLLRRRKGNVSRQRNLGAKMAQGDYLVFFDADVWFGQNFLAKIKKEIEKGKSEFLTCWAKPETRRPEDELLTWLTNLTFETSLIIGKPLVPGWCFIVQKKIFDKIGGFDKDIRLAEDLDLANRIYDRGYKLTILKKPKITVSLRRYRKEGALKVLAKYSKVGINAILRGNKVLRSKLVYYPMGGKAHEK